MKTARGTDGENSSQAPLGGRSVKPQLTEFVIELHNWQLPWQSTRSKAPFLQVKKLKLRGISPGSCSLQEAELGIAQTLDSRPRPFPRHHAAVAQGQLYMTGLAVLEAPGSYVTSGTMNFDKMSYQDVSNLKAFHNSVPQTCQGLGIIGGTCQNSKTQAPPQTHWKSFS